MSCTCLSGLGACWGLGPCSGGPEKNQASGRHLELLISSRLCLLPENPECRSPHGFQLPPGTPQYHPDSRDELIGTIAWNESILEAGIGNERRPFGECQCSYHTPERPEHVEQWETVPEPQAKGPHRRPGSTFDQLQSRLSRLVRFVLVKADFAPDKTDIIPQGSKTIVQFHVSSQCFPNVEEVSLLWPGALL